MIPFLVINAKKKKCLDSVSVYLEEKGYEEDEIRKMESKWAFNGLPSYWVGVVFENESNIRYNYYCSREGQFEYYPLDGKQVPVEELKNYDNHYD